jgi:putative peptide zinc metalloprotease protein
MPNLQPRAFALTRWQLRCWLFGWNDAPPEKFSQPIHYFLVGYSLFTWIYRLTLYLGIAVLVYHFAVKLIGIILFLVELHYFILGPFINEAKVWLTLKDRFRWNTHTILTTTLTAFAFFYCFIPVNQTIQLPATISYMHRFLIAPEEGTLTSDLPTLGTHIAADQTIVTIDSDILNYNLSSTYLAYQKSMNELRRASVQEKYSRQKDILLSSVSKEKANYQKQQDLLSTYNLSIPFSGVIIELAPNLKKGVAVTKNEWLGDVIQPDVVRIDAYAHQTDLLSLKKGTAGYFYPHDLSYPKIKVALSFVELLNANELNCNLAQELKNGKSEMFVDTPCYNASELGGEIATYTTDDGKYVPVESVYKVMLHTPESPKIQQVQRGVVVLQSKGHSLFFQVLYKLKKLIIEQSGF